MWCHYTNYYGNTDNLACDEFYCCVKSSHELQRLFHTQYQRLTSQVPIYTPWWREAVIIEHLAQGHKCHDRETNPHSNDLTTRTIQCSKPLGNDTVKGLGTFCPQCPQINIKLTQFEYNNGRKLPLKYYFQEAKIILACSTYLREHPENIALQSLLFSPQKLDDQWSWNFYR